MTEERYTQVLKGKTEVDIATSTKYEASKAGIKIGFQRFGIDWDTEVYAPGGEYTIQFVKYFNLQNRKNTIDKNKNNNIEPDEFEKTLNDVRRETEKYIEKQTNQKPQYANVSQRPGLLEIFEFIKRSLNNPKDKSEDIPTPKTPVISSPTNTTISEKASTAPPQIIEILMETATPTSPPLVTPPELSLCLEKVKQAKLYYEEHNCDRWIPAAKEAVRLGEIAQQMVPGNPIGYYCTGMGNYYLLNLSDAISNLEDSASFLVSSMMNLQPSMTAS